MYNGILFNLKKVVLPFVTASMSLKGIMLNEINQTEKDSYITPMWILKKKKKLSTQKQQNGGYQGLESRRNGERLVKGGEENGKILIHTNKSEQKFYLAH